LKVQILDNVAAGRKQVGEHAVERGGNVVRAMRAIIDNDGRWIVSADPIQKFAIILGADLNKNPFPLQIFAGRFDIDSNQSGTGEVTLPHPQG
jgi:hypothetical protein